MKTHMRMLSSLALTAAALVTLSSDALAKGGGGGGGGMRSFHVARAPTVVSKVRTTNTAAARSRTASATSHTKTKTSHSKMSHCKKGCDSSSDSKTNPGSDPKSGSQDKDKSADNRHHHRHQHDKTPPDLSSLLNSASQGSSGSPAIDPNASQAAVSPVAASQGTVSQGSGSTVRKRRNVEDRDSRDSSSSSTDGDTKDSSPNSANPNPEQDGNGTRPPQAPTQAPAQEQIGNYPVAVIDQGGGGKISKEQQIRTYPIEAPTVSGGIGAAPAPAAADPPGCVYERSVRKPAGGGLQRVILKICPDA